MAQTYGMLFCSIAVDASKQKKIVHMLRILFAWLIECGTFHECLGRPKLKHRIGKILTERTSAVDFLLKSCILG